jgi:hypothetical protein
LAIGRIPVTKLDPEDRVSGPEDNPPCALENTKPVPKVEITAAELTVRDEPTPTLPESRELPEIPKAVPEIDLVTCNESRTDAEVTVSDPPTPTLPVVVRVEALILLALTLLS